MKTIIIIIAGGVAVALTIWGIGSIYNVSWLQGLVGVGFLVGALIIYLVWFRRGTNKL
jgi:hypothetical protein